MEKFDPVEIDFLLNSEEVKTDSKKIRDNIKGIGDEAEKAAAKAKGAAGGGIADALDQGGAAADRAGKKAAAARPHWNGLGNSINQLTRELPAFTYSAQTGFLALSNNIPILADQVGMLRRQNADLVASGQKGIPIWKQLAKGLFSWNTALSLGVTLITIYGDKIFKFIGNLFKSKEAIDAHAKSMEALNKAYESTEFQTTIKDLIELRSILELARKGLVDKKTALDKYNDTLGKVYEKTDDLNTAEKTLVEKGPALVESMLYRAAATQATADAAKALAENMRKQYETQEEIEKKAKEQEEALKNGPSSANQAQGYYTSVAATAATQQLKETQKQLDELKKTEEEIKTTSNKIITDLNSRAGQIAKDAGLDIFGNNDDKDPDKKTDKFIAERKDLLQKVAEIDRDYAQKRMDQDQEELDALREKFDKIRKLIQDFNNDPKNKQKKIDLTGLGVIQSNAEADLIYKQDTRHLADELEKQKKLYQEIEQYKADFGIEKTREKYGKELAAFETFAALLKSKIEENKDAFEAVSAGTADQGQADRVKLLNENYQEERDQARKNYEELLKDYQTFAQKRKLLKERFDREYKQLLDKGNLEAAKARKDAYQEELNDLDEQQLKKEAAYKALFADIADLTKKEAQAIVANAKLLLGKLDPNGDAYKKLSKLIKEFERDLTRLKSDDIYELGQAIGYFGSQLQELGNITGNPALADMGSFLAGLANGLNLLSRAMDAQDTEDKMDDYMVALEGVMTLINMVASSAARRKQAEEDYYNSVLALQNSYNLALHEQIRLQGELGDSAWLKDYEGRLKAGNEALNDALRGYGDALDKLQEGQVKKGQRNAIDWGNVGSGAATGAAVGSFLGPIGMVAGGIIGGLVGLFGGKKKKDEWGDLLSEYPELIQDMGDGVARLNTELAQSLLDSGLLNEKTEQLVQNALDWEKAMEEARKQIREVIQDLSGSLGDDLRNALVDAFKSGEDAAVAMGDTVEKVLENILSNILFNRIFSDAFKKLEEQMAASYDVGGDSNWVDDFSRFFNEASQLSDDFNQALRDARDEAANFGFDIFQPNDQNQQEAGLQGAIRRQLTEETGSELAGLFRGFFDITKRDYQLNERRFDLEQRHYEISVQILGQLVYIEQNTAGTVVQLKYAVEELKKLNNEGSASARDLGRG